MRLCKLPAKLNKIIKSVSVSSPLCPMLCPGLCHAEGFCLSFRSSGFRTSWRCKFLAWILGPRSFFSFGTVPPQKKISRWGYTRKYLLPLLCPPDIVCFKHCNHARRSLSTVGGTQWPINPSPTTVLSFTFILPPEWCKVSQQVWNRVMNWTWTCVSSTVTFLIDYRVPTTPCTSRLKTKKTKNSFNWSRKHCMDKK